MILLDLHDGIIEYETRRLMLKKFIALRNIGKFREYKSTGDLELRRLTLIFAPNGHGKTTLCDVLRSLQSGRPEYIRGRKTLGGTGEPEAELRLETTTVSFKNNAWTATFPNIAIFDSTFVHENVYAGDYIERDHKKHLYHVVVGQQGVQLAMRVTSLDTEIKEATKAIGDLEDRLRRELPQGMDLKSFLSLFPDPDADRKIVAAKAEVDAASKATEIAQKAALGSVSTPIFPESLPKLLSRELGELSSDAEARVREHLSTHTSGATERWLAEGLDVIKNGECPFCQNPLGNVDLIGIYRTYFGQSYKTLKADIATMASSINAALGEAVLLGIQRELTSNAPIREYWKQFVDLVEAEVDFENEIKRPLMAIRAAAHDLLKMKEQAPLEGIDVNEAFTAAKRDLDEACQRLIEYNATVSASNKLIATRKSEIGAVDLANAKRRLSLLEAVKKRGDVEIDKTSAEYAAAVDRKKKLEAEKKAAKEKLDQYTAQIFLTYQAQINDLLDKFGAGFRITNTTRSYAGGTASSDYQLVINNTPVDLGGPGTPLDSSSFRNTLSAGDRSTLALAFFLAQLDLDPTGNDKVIVFDDPFNSQDRSRRTCTQQLIRRKAQAAKQVIVLSHDPDFLRALWDNSQAASVKTLQCARAGDNTVINEWDIVQETLNPYLNDHRQLHEYQETGKGDRRAVVRCIRPVLEGYVRIRFHMALGDNEWLGDLIKKIRDAASGTTLAAAQPLLTELEDINDFSKKYHHQQNPLGAVGADTEAIDDGELHAFVKRTLAFVAS